MLRSLQLFEIAQTCKDLFIEGFYTQKDIQYKGTVDLVTQYDKEIEKKLTQKLQEVFPMYTVVGEENTQTITYPKRAIYLDPIDGTTNFVHGIPHCAISIGMWEDGLPVAALVYNPILDEAFRADVGKGAFLGEKQLHVSTQTLLQQSLIATGFPYTKVKKGKDYQWVIQCLSNLLPLCRDIRRFGAASLDLCYLAKGTFDAYYECNLKPWDVSAGVLILQEAGGRFTNEKAQPYRLSDHIIVASNGHIHEALLAQL
ncbi:inositol monophosphatase family protein [Sulfurospirillum sp. 1612]|uniref:inositol monophosphatase family protein n=1 Tax=Sulfurospirillum sp. 1612 TaxID=3094835 RepID=UPI002F91F97D